MRILSGLMLISCIAVFGQPAEARKDARFDGVEYYGDPDEGFFGDPSSGYHGMPLRELDEPVRSYRVAKDSDTPYLTLPPARVIEFNKDIYGD